MTRIPTAGIVVAASALAFAGQVRDDTWATWSMERAQAVGRAGYVQGRVGGWFDTRLLKTESVYNYKLAATWMHPAVIRATARVRQLTHGMTEGEARAAVAEAEQVVTGRTVVMVEVDPREGSGVIPLEWSATLQPVGPGEARGAAVRGTLNPALREVPAFQGVLRRNYDYDRFWLTFPLAHESGEPLLPRTATHAELVVRISGKEGRVKWPLPEWLPGS